MTLAPLDRECILDSLRAGCTLAAACSAVGIAPADVYALSADPSEEGRAWAAAINGAIEEGARPRAQAKRIETRKATPPAADGDRWAHVHIEAAELAPGPMGYFLWTDLRCTAAGMPPVSEYWKYATGEFFASLKPWGIFCDGRGSGKSTTLEKLSASASLFTPRRVFPGQVWTWPFISVGPEDANRRITGIAAVYRAQGLSIVGELGEEGERVKEGDGVKVSRAPRGSLDLLDVAGNAIQLASIAGTIGNVSGPSTIGTTVDEAGKLLDRNTHANPLAELIASLAQTSRGREGWAGIVSSSPWDRTGTFQQLVDQGDNESNHVARIGEPFLPLALAGFESVARWEESGADGRAPDPVAAATIREHMRTLTAQSPLVPTWVANPTLGHPDAIAWDGAAVASRKLVQALPERALGGVPRVTFWLRENGAVPMGHGGRNVGAAEQIRGIAKWREEQQKRAEYGERYGSSNVDPWIGKL